MAILTYGITRHTDKNYMIIFPIKNQVGKKIIGKRNSIDTKNINVQPTKGLFKVT